MTPQLVARGPCILGMSGTGLGRQGGVSFRACRRARLSGSICAPAASWCAPRTSTFAPSAADAFQGSVGKSWRLLAGISSDYYLRLEQGRDHHPSAQVIDALARALQLDAEATAHLHALSQPPAARPPPEEPERAPASIEQLITLWPNTPAYVQGRLLDVLAANPLVTAVSPAFTPGVNLVRAVFLDPELRKTYHDWEGLAHTAAARLHALAGPDVDDPALAELVGELSVRSAEFRRLWSRHDVQVSAPHVYGLDHPLVGPLELKLDRFAIIGTDAQVLVVQHAEPGSPSERALSLLAEMVAGERREQA